MLVARKGKLAIRLPRKLFDGEQKYIFLGLPDTPINRSAAGGRLHQIEADIALDRFDYSLERYRVAALTSTGVSLVELWDRFTQHKARELEQTTIERDFKRVRNHLLRCPVKTLSGVPSARRVRSYLQTVGTPATVKKMLMYLRSAASWAVDEGLLQSNPFEQVRVQAKRKGDGPRPFSRNEMEGIIEAFADRHYGPFVKFLFWTGCRTSEAVGLRWGDVGAEAILFQSAIVGKIRKGPKTTIREFPINSQLAALLESIRPESPSPDALVFLAPKGGAVDAHNFLNREWKAVISQLSIPYRPQYATRSTFISLCLSSGVEVVQVAKWVGNSPRTIWSHYAGLISSDSVPLF